MDKDYYHYIRKWFEKWASFYDFIALPLIGVREKVADMIDEEDKIKILDVCTGTGTQAFAFAKIIVVDYHIPKNRFHRWLHLSFASLYESKYYRDFAKRNLEELLREHDFHIVKEAYGLVDFVEILLCVRLEK